MNPMKNSPYKSRTTDSRDGTMDTVGIKKNFFQCLLFSLKFASVAVIQLIGSSSPFESNRASPTGGRRPLPFKRDLMDLSLSLSSGKVRGRNRP
jgi:hypothetical protein